jgi:hypothetical protein
MEADREAVPEPGAEVTGRSDRLPGEPPRNWQPATTIDDYLRNCREGLEEYSDRRAAKLFGWSRIRLYRAKLMAEIPAALFEALLEADINGRELAAIGRVFATGDFAAAEVERCPHCGHPLRARLPVSRKAAVVIARFLDPVD